MKILTWITNFPFKLLRYVLLQLIRAVDFIVLSFVRASRESGNKAVLVVRLDLLGDFILWLDAAKELANIYTHDRYRLVLLGNSAWTELAKELPFWDDVWELDRVKFKRNLLYRWCLMKRIKSAGFTLAIQPIFSREYLYGDSVIRVSRAIQRIGSEGDLSNITKKQKIRSDRWYTRLIPSAGECMPELERNAEFLSGLSGKRFTAHAPSLADIVSSSSLRSGIESYFIVAPGAAWGHRRWPIDRFYELARMIHKATGWCGIICGSPGEKELGVRMMEYMEQKGKSFLKDYTGRTSLLQLVDLVAHANAVISNETGVVHLATAVSVQSICILGGGHFGRFVPYPSAVEKPGIKVPAVVFNKMPCFNCCWHCIYPLMQRQAVPCIKDISVDQAWEVTKRILDALKKDVHG